MSWKIINEVVGRAAVDQEFCLKLLKNPVQTIENAGYQLTQHEKDAIRVIQADDIHEFCRLLLTTFTR